MRATPSFVDERCTAIDVHFPALLSWDYDHEDDALVRLYDKAKRSQWDAARDVDWSIDVDPGRVPETRVPNVKKIGLLTPYVRERFDQLGILQYEDLPASA